MKKIMIVAGLFIIVLLFYFVIKDFQYTPQTEMNQTEEKNKKEESKNEQEDVVNDEYSEYGTEKVQEQIEYMTLDEKIGQLFITGISGTELTDKERDKFERHSLGGVIFFGDNFEDPKQTVKLINDFKKLETINQIPLFLSVDQEGGSVTRLPGLDSLMSAEEIGDTKDPVQAFQSGQLIGKHMQQFGLQLDFAPVLDIHSNPENTVIGDRAFSDKEEMVSEMGIKMMEGLQGQEVISAVKHFPGHGDVGADSHQELPMIEKTYDELKEEELIPFKQAIDKGADMVLVGHLLVEKIDDKYPASLSKDVINILRDDWDYDGVVVTDDLTMGAITQSYSVGDAALQAFKAGNDILLVAHEEENIDEAIERIRTAVSNGEIKESDIDESVERILTLKEKYELDRETVEDVPIDEMNKEIQDVLEDE